MLAGITHFGLSRRLVYAKGSCASGSVSRKNQDYPNEFKIALSIANMT
jgi:hypothetical protein